MAGYIGSKTSVTVISPQTDSRYVNVTGDTMTTDGATVLTVDRATSDGTIIDLQKNGTAVGSIGAATASGVTSIYAGNDDTALWFRNGIDAVTPFSITGNSTRDAAIDFGQAGGRFKDLYLSGNISDGTTSKSVTDIIAGGGQVVNMTLAYNSNTASSGGTQRQLSGIDWWFDDNSTVKGTFTKQESATKIIVVVHMSIINTGGNAHDTYIWVGTNTTGANTQRYHLGHDSYRMSSNRENQTYTAVFTGLATGTYNVLASHGRGDNNPIDSVLNYNTQSYVSTDTANENTRSSIMVWEVK